AAVAVDPPGCRAAVLVIMIMPGHDLVAAGENLGRCHIAITARGRALADLVAGAPQLRDQLLLRDTLIGRDVIKAPARQNLREDLFASLRRRLLPRREHGAPAICDHRHLAA